MIYFQLTTVADLKEVTSISKNIQDDLLEPYILISEEYYVYDILGDALLTELQTQVSGNTATGLTASTITPLNQVLLTQYIRPLAAYGAWFEYLPFSAVKTEQKGEVLQSSDNSQNATLEELTFKRQAIKDKIQFYQDRLKSYLERNKASYPLYRSSCTPNTGSASGIFLNYR